MSTLNIGFYEDLTKLSFNYHQISSNTHHISSSDCSDCQLYFDKCERQSGATLERGNFKQQTKSSGSNQLK